MSIEQIKVADGKYQVFHERGKLWALRNGEPWSRDITGDNLIYWMMMRILELESARAQVHGHPSWWMRETDEGVEWTDAAPLVLSGWTPLYTTPQPAQATQAEVTDSMIRDAFLTNGFTIKDGHSDLKPYVYAAARAILALRPVHVPMTDEQLRDCLRSCQHDTVENLRVRWLYAKEFARAVEAHHGIKPKEQA